MQKLKWNVNHYAFSFLLITLFAFATQTSGRDTEVISQLKAAWHSSSVDYVHTAHLVTDGLLTTFWKSKPGNNHWIYIDLGSVCSIDSVVIHWDSLYAISYQLQVCNELNKSENTSWITLSKVTGGSGKSERISMITQARYVRILIESTFQQRGVALNEVEIIGTDYEIKPIPAKQQPEEKNGYTLNGYGWKIQRATEVAFSGEKISSVDFDDSKWLQMKVPGTVLSGLVAAGAVPDPLFGDNQLQISEAYFTADFWYRRNFMIPENFAGKKINLNLKGINWKAEVFVNGHYLTKIEGAFKRTSLDITHLVTAGQSAAVAVRIIKNDHPGEVTEQHLGDPDPNGGVIGADSPTYMSAIGWNWLPTIRGRNTGITDDIYLSAHAGVSLHNPQIITTLPGFDTTQAFYEVKVDLRNSLEKPVKGRLKVISGYFNLEIPLQLEGGAQQSVHLHSNDFEQLRVRNPKLWWPNGYGKQSLDQMHFSFVTDTSVSDQLSVTYGIRELTYQFTSGKLNLFVNAHRILVRGGNWGLPEALLRCDDNCFDLLVRLHKDMNLNMIRNWVGQTSNDAFYEACDKHGLLIWDDFWLANPVDGPPPTDEVMFLAAATDKVLRYRNHPSMALWVGRNEGEPPASLDQALRKLIESLDSHKMYISSSSDGPVTGLGPYENKSPSWYFKNRGFTFHSEQGIVAFPSEESIREMMPEESLWPINDMWGLHDWTQPRVIIFSEDLEKQFGKADNLSDFCRKAQMLNMEQPKGMIEAWQMNRGPGVLVWMTHPAWPSMICQTYDYYLEPTAAYNAVKKGSEPVHTFLNPVSKQVHVANNTQKALHNYKQIAEVYALNGKKTAEKSQVFFLSADSRFDGSLLKTELPENEVCFVKLTLEDADGRTVSENFYWSGNAENDYCSLNQLPKVQLTATAKIEKSENRQILYAEITNNTPHIALMVRLQPRESVKGTRILPAFWSDNYFSLVSGERKMVQISFENTINEPIELMITGWNIEPVLIQCSLKNE